MSLDEGYIKYRSQWTPGPPVPATLAAGIERWRRPLHAAGLIGEYTEAGIGYGNLSVRDGDGFVISGTQTGHVARTDNTHYARVTAWDIAANSVHCSGPVQASSEAMTHAALYDLDARVLAVVHAHDKTIWQQQLGVLPTTSADVAYGTPRMAREFVRLYAETEFRHNGLAVMAGHDDGILGIGGSLGEAAERVLSLR